MAENNIKLAVTGQDQNTFDVRHFSVHEEMSGLFEVSVTAVVSDPTIALSGIVGQTAALRIQLSQGGDPLPVRVWAGICTQMAHLSESENGVSAYHFTLAPLLWRLTHRHGSRIFQHKSAPDIVAAILAEWEIKPKFLLSRKYPPHEYCVQYDETDFDFISRLLEEVGISYYFTFDKTSGSGNDIVSLVFDDSPQLARNTRKGPLNYVGTQTPAFGAVLNFCANVSLSQRVRTGTVVIRDFDFRLLPSTPLLGKSTPTATGTSDAAYEHYRFDPGAYNWESGTDAPQPMADKYATSNPARTVADPDKATAAQQMLAARRNRELLVSFSTNAIDIRPGHVVGIHQQADAGVGSQHPRPELAPDKTLVITETHIEGTVSGEWSMSASGLFTSSPVVPQQITPRPRILGVQSALVVGPKGQEIWTDEHGRVRIQFHWDREGSYDDNSSCWVRVSQAWAGGGFGSFSTPRVGHEVLVQFFEGNPDLPVIVGSVHNLVSAPPVTMPVSNTVTAIVTNSSPGGGGSNQLRFDDKAGAESIYMQAQGTMATVVNGAESHSVGGVRETRIGTVDLNHIGIEQITLVGQASVTQVGTAHMISVGQTTGTQMLDQKIILSTGSASITIAGDSIFINAKGGIHLHAGNGAEITTKSGNIAIQGGPDVRINDGSSGPTPQVDSVDKANPPQPPGLGAPGTPPWVPSGGGSIPKPGGVPAIQVSTPDNGVDLSDPAG